MQNQLVWKKSTRSGAAGHCVETARTKTGMAVRDSKNPADGMLNFSGPAWDDFIGGVKAGEFDPQV